MEHPEQQQPACVIAEIGVNHDGSVERALEMIAVARDAGADAVKFQTFRSDAIVTDRAPRADYQQRATGSGSQRDMLAALELSAGDFRTIRDACGDHGVEFLSTPFDSASAHLLAELGVSRFKVGSGDLTNLPLLIEIGAFRLPVVLSTGMGTDDEIDEALDVLDAAGAGDVTLLHCISRYPAPAESLQLLRIPALRERFGRAVGYSDHSIGFEAVLGARALGAMTIEKHFTLDRGAPGPDHAASADPEQFRELMARLRRLENMLGSPLRAFDAEELAVRAVARKSIVATRPISRGEPIVAERIACMRPGTGLAPRHWADVLGRTAARDIAEGEPLTWESLAQPVVT